MRTWRTAAAVALGALVPVAIVSGSMLANAAPNPPGNNGTIKIDRRAFDDAPDNEPHVGCTFQLDFYGYDQGDLTADVTFSAHPPTLPAGQDRVLLTDTVAIGEDDNSGGGSQAGLDASVTYRLDVRGIEPHPQQGVHVTLTINAEGSQGADVKHKVFWVTGCKSPSPSPTPTPSGSPSETPSGTPTETPSESPSPSRTSSPTGSPTDSPGPSGTTSPTDAPSVTEEPSPSQVPSETESPTEVPTESPTDS